jgi:hypothetical protein
LESGTAFYGAVLKTIDGRVLLFVLLVQLGQAQSRTHKIVCPDSPSREACDLFNETVEDDDENIYKASTRDHVLVCLRPNSNLFLLLSYDLPRENLWKDKSGGGVQQSGSVDFYDSSMAIRISAVSHSLLWDYGFRRLGTTNGRFAFRERHYRHLVSRTSIMWILRRVSLQ